MKYNITTTEEKVEQGMSTIRRNGGTIYKDGTFEVSGVEGYYNFSGGSLTITITRKPFLASDGMIRSKLDNFFG